MSKMQDWNAFRETLTARVGEFTELTPDVMRGLQVIQDSPEQTRQLDPKTRTLIALAVAVTTRCDGCIAVHSKKAVDAGAAVTYTARVFDAIDALPAS